MKRREFCVAGGITVATAVANKGIIKAEERLKMVEINDNMPDYAKRYSNPIVISTWAHGFAANDEASKILESGGYSLDAVEMGVRVAEDDPNVTSVGYGGYPDRDGKVTLDACIMDEKGNCGSVAFLQHFKNPISVARAVMEKTKHVMLVGKGAEIFALKNGFKKENLLTKEAKEYWEKFLKNTNYTPDIEASHDTISMLAIDINGSISGSCTTSGQANKMHGRVGDSPIIGAGLFVDSEVGAACATGLGEAVIKVVGSHAIVEMMRNGANPQQACRNILKRVIKKLDTSDPELQIAFLAMSIDGEIGVCSLRKGFQFALYSDGKNVLIDSEYLI